MAIEGWLQYFTKMFPQRIDCFGAMLCFTHGVGVTGKVIMELQAGSMKEKGTDIILQRCNCAWDCHPSQVCLRSSE